MRSTTVLLAAAVVVLLAVAAVVVIVSQRAEQPTRSLPALSTRQPGAAKPGTSEPSVAPPPQPVPIRFTRDGQAGKITQAVERVTRPGRTQVAVHQRDGGRWVCIVADPGVKDRYYALDGGMTLDDLPALEGAGFRPPPSHIARTSTSIYRSMAKRAMGYDHARGDRIIILLCPRAEWPSLGLHWPALKPEAD